jgi:hypothetical protein
MSGRVGIRNELVDALFPKKLICHAIPRHPLAPSSERKGFDDPAPPDREIG